MNPHPLLTSFPLVLLWLVLAAELWLLLVRPWPWATSMIRVHLVAAVFATMAAFFSGYQASELANQTFRVPDSVISLHHAWGRALLFLVVVTAAAHEVALRAQFHRSAFRTLYRVLLIASVISVSITNYLGGTLVFEHGAAVRAEFAPERTP